MLNRQLTNRVDKLEADLKWWRDRYMTLEAAYNELFDFLADELGFMGETGYSAYYYGPVKLDPRRLKKTIPPMAQVERVKKGK